MSADDRASVPVDLLKRAVDELRRHALNVHESMHNGALSNCADDSCPGLVALSDSLDAVRPRPLTARLVAADSFLTVKDVAARLSTSPMTVYRLIYAKRLRANDIGTGEEKARLRISEGALAEFMAGTVLS